MKVEKYSIETSEATLLMKAITRDLPNADYINVSSDMTIIGYEVYKLRNNSTQMNMLVLKKDDNNYILDVIGAAGGSGIFNISFWSESGFIKQIKRLLTDYCDKHQIRFEQVESSQQH